MELLIATHNQNKKSEIQSLLPEYRVTSLSDYNLKEEIVEDGDSFAANARIKAAYCFAKTGKPSIGEDSGLVIPALNGRPGIHSARYAGDHDAGANMQKVLEELKDSQDRSCYFTTVICYLADDVEEYFEGRVYGTIAHQEQGTGGFGYDPIFLPEGSSLSFGELSLEEKNKISHRARALHKLLTYLKLQKP